MSRSEPILDAVTAVVHDRFGVTPARARSFTWPVPDELAARLLQVLRAAARVRSSEPGVQAPPSVVIAPDLYLPPPLHGLLFLDTAAHCTRERAALLAAYPADVPLSFDVRRYQADAAPGDADLALQDALADLLPPRHGFNPTVRLRADDFTGIPAPDLPARVAALLASRLAVHAGTTFQAMLDTAGGKPHHTSHR